MNNQTKVYTYLRQLNLLVLGVFVSLCGFHSIGQQPSLIGIAEGIALACGVLIIHALITSIMLSSFLGLKTSLKAGSYLTIATLSWVFMGNTVGAIAAVGFEYFKIFAIDPNVMFSCVLFAGCVHVTLFLVMFMHEASILKTKNLNIV